MTQPLQQVADLLRAISHPSRLRILKILSEQGPLNVSAIKKELGIEQSLVSHYLIRMRDLGLLASTRQGKEVFYKLLDPTIVHILNILLSRSG